MEFSRFIAVDWSGAKNSGNICVAECSSGSIAPYLVPCPEGTRRTRTRLMSWLQTNFEVSKTKLVAGFDFAFAFPYCEKKAYFPGHPDSPSALRDLWATVDLVCKGSPDFYGGPFYSNEEAPFADYLCHQTYTGSFFSSGHRSTERACAEQATPPTSVYKCVGPDQVGPGSIAGMRFLHALTLTNKKNLLSIWPFEDVMGIRVTIVEVFPRLFFLLAGCNPKQSSNSEIVNIALKYYGSEPLDATVGNLTEDKSDALVSAAALRNLSINEAIWKPKSMTECAKTYEGWIFGVR